MDIEMQGVVEDVTKSELMDFENLATWNQKRTTEQLLGFITRQEARISGLIDE